MTTRFNTFLSTLTDQYRELFINDSEYSYVASQMTANLLAGTADKDGRAIKQTCKILKIAHTYKAIREHLTVEST